MPTGDVLDYSKDEFLADHNMNIHSRDYSTLKKNLEYVRCDLCGDDNIELLFCKKGTLTGELFNIVRCRNDGLVYVNPRISKVTIKQLYDEWYYKGEGFDTNVNYEADIQQPNSLETLHKRDMSHNIVRLAKSLGIDKGRLLDVGCGNGQLLRFMKDLGFEVFGTDISPSACQISRRQGLDVFYGEITDESLLPASENFDIITATEVLEHLHNPKAYLQKISSLLKPGGLFYYTTGNADRIRVEGQKWNYLNAEGHIYYFSPSVIEIYFAQVGLRPLSPYEYPPFYAFSTTSFYQHTRNIAKELLLRSKLLRLMLLRPYLEFTNSRMMPLGQKPLN